MTMRGEGEESKGERGLFIVVGRGRDRIVGEDAVQQSLCRSVGEVRTVVAEEVRQCGRRN